MFLAHWHGRSSSCYRVAYQETLDRDRWRHWLTRASLTPNRAAANEHQSRIRIGDLGKSPLGRHNSG